MSPIGAGSYYKTLYKFDDGSEKVSSFIVEVLAEHIKAERVFLLGTSNSGWVQLYEHFTELTNETLDIEYLKILEQETKKEPYDIRLLDKVIKSIDTWLYKVNSSSKNNSKAILLKYGIDNEELMENFSEFMKIIDLLEDGDEIHIDITHAFRSIPVFMYLILEFIETLNYKKIKLCGMYYGMSEARTVFDKVDIIDYPVGENIRKLENERIIGDKPKNGKIPVGKIVNLKPILDISKWIRSTHDFINYGNGYGISTMIENDVNSNEITLTLGVKIKDISNLTNINFLVELRHEIKNMNSLLNTPDIDRGIIKYIKPILLDFTNRFSRLDTDSEFQLDLAKWYIENKRYGHGYICLVEAILTKTCELYGENVENLNNRNLIKSAFFLTKKVKTSVDIKKYGDLFHETNSIRKKIAHASFISESSIDKIPYNRHIEKAQSYADDMEKLFNSPNIQSMPNIITIEMIKRNYKPPNKNKRR
nr:TIGR02221 family CRISPR-associated protein [Proteiniborus ethanoligenes]